MKTIITILLLFSVNGFICGEELPTPEEVLANIDKNMVFTTARAEMEMIITIKNRVITKRLTSFSEGNDRSFIHFTYPARDKGTKMLKKDGVIRIYYPSAERVVRLSGHMLKRSMMGSDFSYEDMTERAKKLKEEYKAEITGTADFNGIPCYLMTMTSRVKKQTYFTRKVWIDKERFLALKEELYAKSGKLLKVSRILDIYKQKDRYYPVKIELEDKLRKNSKTEIIFKRITFDIPVPEGIFEERNLRKK